MTFLQVVEHLDELASGEGFRDQILGDKGNAPASDRRVEHGEGGVEGELPSTRTRTSRPSFSNSQA